MLRDEDSPRPRVIQRGFTFGSRPSQCSQRARVIEKDAKVPFNCSTVRQPDDLISFSASQLHWGFAIELYFDPALENQVLKAWNVLARRQVSTQLIEMESRPHITLLSSPLLDLPKLENIIKNFASKQEPLALSFSTVGSFPNGGHILFLGPTPSLALLQFHSQLCDELKKENVEISEEYSPDSWVPYCSVAQEVPKNRIAEAFSVLRDLKLPITGIRLNTERMLGFEEVAVANTFDWG
ncbi:hypothetical protein NE237_021408 [Protea cynaroides]|uniref:RNA ligase/cyclic nucleotide phosphodiesterase n=1 Tax=Protea cynaroides TaxID=273540 RepID=A0A9Q0H8G9_9MAGN|nr:hypothetical protein NE237_021408 [Protea cynaroides]